MGESTMTEKERMLSGQLYKLPDSELNALLFRSRKLQRLIAECKEGEIDRKNSLYKQLLGCVGKKFWIGSPFYCDYGSNIYIGENFVANYDCIMLDVCPITIGNNVLLGPRVSIYTAMHPLDAAVRDTRVEYGKPVKIGDSVWIGGSTIINPGVTIGNRAIIGSGSVVTKDISDNVIAAGNPCRILRSLTEEDRLYWEGRLKIYESSKKNI